MIKISKQEMQYLTSKGVRYGENGIISTTGHNSAWYMTESKRNKSLLEKYRATNVK